MIGIRIAAKKRWGQRKKNKKCVEKDLQLASSGQPRGKSPDAAEQQGAELCNIQEKSPDVAKQLEEQQEKSPEQPKDQTNHQKSLTTKNLLRKSILPKS